VENCVKIVLRGIQIIRPEMIHPVSFENIFDIATMLRGPRTIGSCRIRILRRLGFGTAFPNQSICIASILRD